MSKKENIADKILSVRIPKPFFNKFKMICDNNFKTMSDTIRDFVREYIKNNGEK